MRLLMGVLIVTYGVLNLVKSNMCEACWQWFGGICALSGC